MKQICSRIISKEFFGNICLFSVADICQSGYEPITENSAILPRTERDLSYATAENMLNVMMHHEKNMAALHIMRLGSIYGNEIGLEDHLGFINKQIRNAQQHGLVEISVFGDVKRSVIHISDVCESAIRLMLLQNDCPDLINIPGEEKSISEITAKIIDKFNTKAKKKCQQPNDQFYYLADQIISDNLFKSIADFKRKFSFDCWIGDCKMAGMANVPSSMTSKVF